jgi:hypothetical protein
MFVLDAQVFKHHVDFFHGMEPENIVNYVPNREAWAWMKDNVPFFECPDKDFEQIYYFRWWTFRKHLKQTPDGFMFTEFLDKVGHSGTHNTISCALGHTSEGLAAGPAVHRQYAASVRGQAAQPHFHRYSNWATWALYRRYLVNQDRAFLTGLLDAFVSDYQAWEKERGLENGLFWQYDVLDGMEESISGGRRVKNARPPLNSYLYAGAVAISKVAEMAGRDAMPGVRGKLPGSSRRRELLGQAGGVSSAVPLASGGRAGGDRVHPGLRFAVVVSASRRSCRGLAPNHEQDAAHGANAPPGTLRTEQAWRQLLDPQGFKAPMGITTAERRHPQFRSHGVGTCEWDGAVWPFATSQTLAALANVLRNYQQPYVSKADYFDALLTYARSHRYRGKPYIGEYLDEQNGTWLKPDSDRSRYYNHSTFCDLVISGLVGLVPRADDTVVVDPLIPAGAWDWFCLDNVIYHGWMAILWDRIMQSTAKAAAWVFADGVEIAPG